MAATHPATDLGGVVVATALPYRRDASAPGGLAVDHDGYAHHCRWLISSGCRGVGPNGSLGEYSSLTDTERRAVVRTAVEAVDGVGIVVAGVHGAGAHQAQYWARCAAEDGADAVLCLPPTMYRANRAEIRDHYAAVAAVGLPVMLYNNPTDTRVDLTPDLIAELAGIDNVVAVKEFSGDPARVARIRELAPDLQVVAGADDLLWENLADGATGWFAGFPNAFPVECVRMFDLIRAGEAGQAEELHAALLPLFRWDSRTEFVQAVKAAMDMAGRKGGPCRPPRGPLVAEHRDEVMAAARQAMAHIATLETPRPREAQQQGTGRTPQGAGADASRSAAQRKAAGGAH
ncbi:4-hydroxy-tetrahydrodipicolinate synthase [Nocardiopsis mwathae]|uniref:4-hydroxy-tetrahydrodipicolinate synthase n=1 Tax=Nocardiopsis mwathae TaxID=1472723 RepID=A0A7X0D5K3_9ACTN|nr:dihydrodipicolinate synthase family protein [Nocardiopsis mwathae]MBB6172310.1 4-hydroxy-tetrahydrodipicolinate synthase [Nocardiopsis mwathae]